MNKPIILITAGRQNHYTPRREVQTVTIGCDIDYLTSLLRAGGTPLLLPCVADAEAVRAAVEVADGLLLSGGGDILSLAYGEEPHQKSKLQDAGRDAMELEAARLAMEKRLPILGICRGHQLLNVACGGTLIQDISSQVPEAIKHYSEGLDVLPMHTIDLAPDSLLAQVMQTPTLVVNSWHHQAVQSPGQGLRISARARDGIVEAIESSAGLPILGVQCHPEECTEQYTTFRRIFDWLITEARAYREWKTMTAELI